jgi:hypothetical protein
MKQRSPVSVANGIRSDCVASTMHSRLYFPQQGQVPILKLKLKLKTNLTLF